MKIIGIDEENNIKNINKKKLIITSIIISILIIFVILFIIYISNKPFRDIIDKYVLMKNVVEDSTTSISLDESENYNIYAYDKYISILSKNTLKNYNSSGKLDGEVTVEISNPIISTNGKFLLIGEKDGNKIYLVSGNELIWKKELEGSISNITVNKNGYVSAILSGTMHKSVIQTFDNLGNELFKTYLSATTAIDADISLDNQYLAFAEINTSGTSIQSTVKIVSIQKAKTQPKESIIYTKSIEDGSFLTNIKYQENNKLACMYDNGIYIIKDNTNEKKLNLLEDNMKISFGGIELSNYIFRVIEKSSILNTQTSIEIFNTNSDKTSLYTLDGVPKEIYSYNDKIGINLGSEVHFIGTNGWLIKKYISSQEIRKIVMCKDFAGIVYRNKIEIINL